MATTVTERFQENAAGATWRVGASATRSFQVHFDTVPAIPSASAINAKAAVLSNFAVAIGVAHPSDSTIMCTDIKVSCVEDDLLTWRVICTYSRPEYEPPPPPPTPTLTKPVISFSSVTRQIIPAKAFGGALEANPGSLASPAAIVAKNSANDILMGIQPVDQVNGIIRIGLYLATYNAGPLLTHLNRLNNGTVTIAGITIPKWQARINSINANKVFEENGTDYHFIVDYEIEFMIDTPMYHSILDAGMKELNSGVLREISHNGRPETEPWPLNGSGVALTPTEKATAANFKYWRYFYNMDANWATLGLPETL